VNLIKPTLQVAVLDLFLIRGSKASMKTKESTLPPTSGESGWAQGGVWETSGHCYLHGGHHFASTHSESSEAKNSISLNFNQCL
jgi:hypothetical protein